MLACQSSHPVENFALTEASRVVLKAARNAEVKEEM
jgi:hypothetical protein